MYTRPVFERIHGSGDVALSWLALVAENIARDWSWKFGAHLVTSIRRAHESWLRATRWANAVDGDLEHATDYPFVGVEFPASQPTEGLAVHVLSGNCGIAAGVILPFHRISWLDDSFAQDSQRVRFRFHSLEWLADILDASERTGDARYVDAARELIARWLRECLYREGNLRTNIWDDHITALRAIALCKAWNIFRANQHATTDRLMPDLTYALIRHARKLALKAFYRPGHNHGVTQGYGLLAIGLTLRTHFRAKRWVDLARGRLERQMAVNVSSDGLHREHSPFYHFYVLAQFHQAYRLAQTHDVAFSAAFTERLAAMFNAGRLLLKPDGRLPALGDTNANSPVLFRALTSDLEHRKPEQHLGESAGACSVLFRDGGYAVLRTGRSFGERPSDERFLVARLSTFRTSHIHRDLLSFELYGWGQDLIVDSGGPFKYGHPLREEYFLSTRAHSTVLVDGRDQALGSAHVLNWQQGRGCDVVVAEHRSYVGVRHCRLLALIPPGYLLVIDRLDGLRPHRYSQLFHLHQSLSVSLDQRAVWTTNRTGGPTVRIIPLILEAIGLSLHSGLTAPHQGWICDGEAQMAEGPVVEYQGAGARVTFAALVIPERPGHPESVRAHVNGAPLESVSVVIAEWVDRTDIVSISPSGEVTLEASHTRG
jgi:hypothetical protein